MKFALYMTRWIVSGIVMAVPFNVLSKYMCDTANMIICSVIGACMFWLIDLKIFKK